MRHIKFRRLFAVVAAVLTLLLFGWAPSASAHATLVSSSPANGATLTKAPTSFVLTFDENVEVGPAKILIYDGSGRLVHVGKTVGDGNPKAADAKALAVTLPHLGKDRYLVRWTTITSDDLHPVDGRLNFGVGVAVQAAVLDPGRGVGAPGETLLRGAAYLGFALVVGAFELLLLLRRALRDRPQAVRTLSRAAIAGASVSVGGLLAVVALLTWRSGSWPSAVYLRHWSTAVVGVVALAAATRLLARRSDRAGGAIVVGVVGAAAVTVTGWGFGHLGHGAVTAGVLVTTLHLVSTACWAGGVALLVVLAIGAARDGQHAWNKSNAARFTFIAVPALGLSIFSGALMARGVIPSWGGLFNTDYGLTLVLKLLLVLVAMTLGALTFVRTRARQADGKLRQRLGAELAVIVLIITAAAAMSGGRPPNDLRWQPGLSATPTQGTLSAQVDDVVLTLGLTPAQPGQNFASVQVLEVRRPAPAPIGDVFMSFDRAKAVKLVRQSPTDWLVPVSILKSGAHLIGVAVKRPGAADSNAQFSWVVAPNPGTQLGGAPLSAMWILLATATALVGTCLAGFAFWRRRKHTAHGQDATAPLEVVRERSSV